ncbi:hypothetical protein ABW21_db0205934 [Orbilia brochopaga]|nr:hypothetical protein ABW21_db0205934 [Drechslerella brochopaga]
MTVGSLDLMDRGLWFRCVHACNISSFHHYLAFAAAPHFLLAFQLASRLVLSHRFVKVLSQRPQLILHSPFAPEHALLALELPHLLLKVSGYSCLQSCCVCLDVAGSLLTFRLCCWIVRCCQMPLILLRCRIRSA